MAPGWTAGGSHCWGGQTFRTQQLEFSEYDMVDYVFCTSDDVAKTGVADAAPDPLPATRPARALRARMAMRCAQGMAARPRLGARWRMSRSSAAPSLPSGFPSMLDRLDAASPDDLAGHRVLGR